MVKVIDGPSRQPPAPDEPTSGVGVEGTVAKLLEMHAAFLQAEGTRTRILFRKPGWTEAILDAAIGLSERAALATPATSPATPPIGYHRLPDGQVCKCIKSWTHPDGSRWCCLALATPSPAPAAVSALAPAPAERQE